MPNIGSFFDFIQSQVDRRQCITHPRRHFINTTIFNEQKAFDELCKASVDDALSDGAHELEHVDNVVNGYQRRCYRHVTKGGVDVRSAHSARGWCVIVLGTMGMDGRTKFARGIHVHVRSHTRSTRTCRTRTRIVNDTRVVRICGRCELHTAMVQCERNTETCRACGKLMHARKCLR